MNTELRKLAKDDFEKDLFKVMNNAVFGKIVENIRKHRVIKIVTTEDLSIIELMKTKVKMNKPIYLGLSILDIIKILMYEFWSDYIKLKYKNK